MNKTMKIAVIIALIVAIGAVIAFKQQEKKAGNEPSVQIAANSFPAQTQVKLPKLIDFGADKCVPCKMMKPILDELGQSYKEKFEVVFVDVWKNQEEAGKYGINLIPTQIFYNADGKELFRHEGFYSKEEILAKWKEFGIEL